MTVRPLVIDSKETMMLLAGEQRLKALSDLGYTDLDPSWVKFADKLSAEQKRKFILLDNHHSGAWDISKLTESWNIDEITNWDITIPELDLTIPDLFDIEATETVRKKPSASADDYSVFELVMLHENKKKLLDFLDEVRAKERLEKIEDALMHIIATYPIN